MAFNASIGVGISELPNAALRVPKALPNSSSCSTVPVSDLPSTARLIPAVAALVAPDRLKWGENYSDGYHYVVKRHGEIVTDIIGAAHADEQKICQLNPRVEKAVKRAKSVAFESVWDAERIKRFNTHVQNSKAEIRKQYLDFYQKNYRASEDYKYQPSFSSSSTITRNMSYANGTDTLVENICKASGIAMISLETPEEIAEGFNYQELAGVTDSQKIVNGLMSAEAQRIVGNDLTSAFKSGYEPSFTQAKNWNKHHDPAYHHHVVKKRNKNQAEQALPHIRQATSDNRFAIVVGSNHLFGKNGVINLVKNGLGPEYSIERSCPHPGTIVLRDISDIETVDQNLLEEFYILDLSDSDITDGELQSIIAHFPNIAEVNAKNCKGLTDGALAAMAKWPHLISVDLTGCPQITEAGLKPLKALPNLNIVR